MHVNAICLIGLTQRGNQSGDGRGLADRQDKSDGQVRRGKL